MLTVDDLLSEQHALGEGRKKFVRSVFHTITKHLDEDGKEDGFTDHPLEMTESEVHKCLEWLKSKCHTDQSWNGYVAAIRTVYRWKFERDGGEGFPDSVRKIKLRKVRREDDVRKKILSEREVRALIEVADNQRDKALVGSDWEGGFRPGELLSMTVGGCEKTSAGFNVTVTGKTGTRTLPIVVMAPLLEMWLYCHPAREDRESPLWTKRKGNRFVSIKYSEVAKIIKVLARRAGLTRRVHMYMMRHSQCTEYARHRIGDSMMRKVFGWTPGSQMPAIYTHLVPGDVEDTVLALRGVKKVERIVSEQILEPKTCFRCGERNPFDGLFCVKCSSPLSQEGADLFLKREEVLKLLGDPEVLDGFKEYVNQRRKGKTESKT